MKFLLLSILMLNINILSAQNDSLPSGVFNWSNAKTVPNKNGERRDLLNGSTLDLKNFDIHTTLLNPGLTNHPMIAYNDKEEIIIVKEGSLTVTINDSTKILTAGGIVLIVAGDAQSFKNTSNKPVIYYVLTFQSKNAINILRGNESGGSFMKDWNELVVKKTDKGESRAVFEKPSSAFTKFSVHVTNLNAGTTSHLPHVHRAEEIMLLLKGSGELQVGQAFKQVAAGDVMYLEANLLHAFKNTGTEQCSYYAIQWNN